MMRYRVISIFLIIAAALSLAGCGSKKNAAVYTAAEEGALAEYTYAEDYYSGLGVSNDGDVALPETASTDASQGSQSSDTDLRPDKIIYTGNATVETTEFEKSLESLKKLIEANDGFIESSSIEGYKLNSSNKNLRYADYTIRIPSTKFDTVMNGLSDVGNVPRNEVYTDNISSQYYDAQARLSSYQATEKRLLELLEKAESVSDIIEIERELSDVRYNIESTQSMIKGWDNKVSYSTINVHVKEVSEYTPAEETGFLHDLWDAVKEGFSNLGIFILAFVEILPSLLVLAAICYGVVKLILKFNKVRKEKKAKKNSTESSEK